MSQSDPTCAENAHGPIIFCIAEFIIQELVRKEQVLYLITNWLNCYNKKCNKWWSWREAHMSSDTCHISSEFYEPLRILSSATSSWSKTEEIQSCSIWKLKTKYLYDFFFFMCMHVIFVTSKTFPQSWTFRPSARLSLWLIAR